MFRDDFVNILFVGRITPNKFQHELIRFYGYFKRFVQERSRLFLVGKIKGFERYYNELIKMTSELKLGDVYILGQVDQNELVTYYQLADVFVSMSKHEGFCVPLIESMYFQVPIIAYKAAAVPYTLDNAGVQFNNDSNLLELAELTKIVCDDSKLRQAVITRQKHRLCDFSFQKIAGQWHQEIIDN